MALTKVSSNLVADNAIVTGKIADGTIAAADIAVNAVTSTKIAENNINTREILSGAVVRASLAADVIDATKLADDAVSEEHLDVTVISSLTEVTPVAGDYVMIGDTSDSNNLKKVLVSGLAQNEESPTFTGNVAVGGTLGVTGAITGNLTGNASGTALTVTQAAQTAITSLGTLTGLTVAGNPLASGADGTVRKFTFGNESGNHGSIGVDASGHTFIDAETAGGATYFKDAGTTNMTITSAGKVGIGITTPNEAGFGSTSSVLSIAGTAQDAFGVLELISTDVTSSNRIGEIRFGNLDAGSSFVSNAGIRATRDGADNSSALSLWYSNAGSFTEGITLKADGKVGIGTTSPVHMLEVSSTGDAGIHIRADSDNSGEGDNPYLSMSQDGSTAAQFKMGIIGNAGDEFTNSLANSSYIHADNDASQPLMFAHDDALVMTLKSGKVGIGTATPAYPLNIFGAETGEGHAVGQLGIQSTTVYGSSPQAGITFTNEHTTGSQAIMGSVRVGKQNTNNGNYSSFMAFDTRTHGDTSKERMRIDADGNVGIGTASPSVELHVYSADQNALKIQTNTTINQIELANTSNSPTYITANGYSLQFKADDNAWGGTASSIEFRVKSAHSMSIDSTGIVYICPSTLIKPTIVHSGGIGSLAKLRLINRSGQSVDKGGLIEFGGVTDDSYTRSDVFGAVGGFKANSTSANREGYLQFLTSSGSALTERMRIDSSGNVFVGKTALNQTTTTGITMRPTGTVLRGDFSVANNEFVIWNNYGSPAGTAAMQFRYDNSAKGSIGLTSSAVSFNTSSDYRLKENVSYSWDATTRLKQLKPARFNWIEDDTNTLIDGFLAHEVSSIVPEAITGEKDAVYPVGHELEEEINPQGIDQSKLVPLLVKAIQELEARITTLEG